MLYVACEALCRIARSGDADARAAICTVEGVMDKL